MLQSRHNDTHLTETKTKAERGLLLPQGLLHWLFLLPGLVSPQLIPLHRLVSALKSPSHATF